MKDKRKILAVIGSAGRGTDADKMNRSVYDRMYDVFLEFIRHVTPDDYVSGGAPWADHLVIRACLAGVIDPKSVTIFMPCGFRRSIEAGVVSDADFGSRDGASLKRHHSRFTKATGINGPEQIIKTARMGCRVIDGHDFHERNRKIASHATIMIAYTFGNCFVSRKWQPIGFNGNVDAERAGIKKGGTSYTWDRFDHMKFHVCME